MTRPRWQRGSLLLAGALLAVAPATPANARGDAQLGPDGLNGGLNVPGGPSVSISTPGPTSGGTQPSTSNYAYQSLGTPCSLTGPGTGAVQGTPNFNPNGTQGTVNALVLTTGGQNSLVNYVCVVAGQAPPPPPPPPPTPAEVWGKVPLSAAAIGVSPGEKGLTGLETMLWYEGSAQGVELRLHPRLLPAGPRPAGPLRMGHRGRDRADPHRCWIDGGSCAQPHLRDEG